MRYFISFWVVLTTIFIFSGQLQAADVAEQVEKQSIANPIEPIEPKASTKGSFWQKTKQKLQLLRPKGKINTEVTPIDESLYRLLAVLGILGFIPSILFILLAFGSVGWLWILLGILAVIGFLAMIFYVIKLFQAANGKDSQFLKGQRFLLGYLTFLFVCTSWLLFITGMQTFGVLGDGRDRSDLRAEEIAAAVIVSLVASLPFLIFNIIDHLRHRKYRKSQQNNQ